ncbi:MAG TPA: peptidylprolyl isomerase [Terriglobales bacterium]
MRTFLTALVCLFLAGGAIAQSNSQPELKPRVNTPVQDLPSPTPEQQVAPDAPVITINGLCDNPSANADCKTVITRAQFEEIAKTAQPNMPKPQEKQFATRYVTALFLAQRAHELGLDKGPQYDLMRLQMLASLAIGGMQKEAAKVSDAEIQDYYNQHSADFKTISYDKLFVPKQKQADSTLKPNDPGAQTKRAADEAAMKAEADKLRARAVSGEDFTKLQQEAYDFSGEKLKAANTRVDNVPKTGMLPSDASIFQLKAGEVSEVITDPQAFMIYKVDTFQQQPLADVRQQIVQLLQREKMTKFGESLQQMSTQKATYDDAYFATQAGPSLRNPGEAPSNPVPPAPGKK